MSNLTIFLLIIIVLFTMAGLGVYLKLELHKLFASRNNVIVDIEKRLALIDNAQKNLDKLSNNILGLQDILNDKTARGAFGEVQLKNLLANMLPSNSYALQYTLSNGMRVDCMLFLPEPTGNIAIDSKFPLENFNNNNDAAFKQDLKKHIKDIASKYIIPGETANGAIMFIPAEAIFAAIHSSFRDIVEFAQRKNVWLVSPSTMMAVITTVTAVLQDVATKKHVHIIQEHLALLGQDFVRFNDRMQKLVKHIEMTKEDITQVNTSASKIISRFTKIEQVELE